MRQIATRLDFWIMVLILLLGAVLRIPALEQSPPGLAPDEASNGYDAYSLWHTGRDQHGYFLPPVMRAMNDYRMPLFEYSAAPIVGLGGLSVMTARLTAAYWGILTVAAIYWLGREMFGRVPAAGAAFFLAISPWHVPFSRLALEAITTPLASILVIAMVLRWTRLPRDRFLLGSAAAIGLSIYTYSVMPLFLIVMLPIFALLFRRVWISRWPKVTIAIVIAILIASPWLYYLFRYTDAMLARHRQIAVFRPERPLPEAAQEAIYNLWLNLSPDFLFGKGDHDELQHPRGLGQLYPVQALFIPLGIWYGIRQKHHRRNLLITGAWILAGTLPAALTQPNLPGSGHSLRALPAVIPWQLLTGLGIEVVQRLAIRPALRSAILVSCAIWIALNAGVYYDYYFTRYPSDLSPRFESWMRETVETMHRLDNGYNTVYFTCHSRWAYLYILFFTRYPPRLLQADLPVRGEELFAHVSRIGRYHFVCDMEPLWATGEKGLFVVTGNELPDVLPLASITGPEGQTLFKIIARDK